MKRFISAVAAFLASISALPFSHPEVSKRLEDTDDEQRHGKRNDPTDRPSDVG